jgi:fluoride exporter
MRSIIYVGTGSFLGGVLRYLLTTWAYKNLDHFFPYGTLAVNGLGSFIDWVSGRAG